MVTCDEKENVLFSQNVLLWIFLKIGYLIWRYAELNHLLVVSGQIPLNIELQQDDRTVCCSHTVVTLNIEHHTLMLTKHYILDTVPCILHTEHYKLQTVYYIWHTTSTHCTHILKTLHWTPHTAHSTLYTVHFTLIHYTLYTKDCTRYAVHHLTLHTLNWTLHIAHFIQCSPCTVP